MKKVTLTFYSDPYSGWLKTPVEFLRILGIAHKITSFSYQKGDFVYLDEETDMARFIGAAEAAGWGVEVKSRRPAQGKSRIRRFYQYLYPMYDEVPRESFIGKYMDSAPSQLVTVSYDVDSQSPTEWWDGNAPTIVCRNRKYVFGHKDGIERLRALLPYEGEGPDERDLGDLYREAKKKGSMAAVVYAYDHGGLQVSLAPFSCPWDSGILGIMVWTSAQMNEICPEYDPEKQKSVFESFFKEWAQNIHGQVFCVRVSDLETGEEPEPPLSGIYDEEGIKEGIKDFGIDPESLKPWPFAA
jgi:hypothetical protein